MAVGGDVKVVLTLDDAGFSVKSKEAADTVKQLNTQFKEATKSAESVEARFSTLGKNASETSKDFKSLQTTVDKLGSQLAKIGQSLTSFNANTKAASDASAALARLVSGLTDGLTKNADAAKKAADAEKGLSEASNATAASTKGVVNALSQKERQLVNVGSAANKMAEQIALSYRYSQSEKAKALAAEINANNKAVEQRKTNYNSLLQAERQYQQRVAEEKSRGYAIEEQMAAKIKQLGPYGAKNVVADLQRELDLHLQKVAALQRSATLIGEETTKTWDSITALQSVNKQLQDKLALEMKSIDNQNRLNQANREQMEMLKGMAQLWGASKIEHGMKSSVDEASMYQRNQMRAMNMGLTDQERASLEQKSWQDSSRLRFLSANEAMTSRLAAMGGLADYKNADIDNTIEHAMKVAFNVQTLRGDNSKEGFENMVRNLYGVVESRQQTQDAGAANRTMDLVQKIYGITGNKIDIADLETFMRRFGTGANSISDEGILRAVAFLDQAKVSGGHGGGGAGGISTVGTMFRMLQSYINGKTLSNNALQELGAAGLLNTDGIDHTQTAKKQIQALKHNGLDLGGIQNVDPVEGMRRLADAAMKMMTSDEYRKKYFGNKSTNDEQARRDAMAKFANGLGWSSNAVNMLLLAADPRAMARVEAQAKQANNAPGGDKLNAELMKNYDANVKAFDSSLKNLKQTLGATVLPLLTDFFNWISKIVQEMANFAKNHPMVTELTMIAGAIGSVVMGALGFMKVFGIFTDLGKLLKTTAGGTAEVATKTSLLGTVGNKAVAGLSAVWTEVKKPITQIGPLVEKIGSKFSWVGSLLAPLGSVFSAVLGPVKGWLAGIGEKLAEIGTKFGVWKAIGIDATTSIASGFLKLLNVAGWIWTAWTLGWDFGTWLGKIKVGTLSISDHMGRWMEELLIKAKKWAVEMSHIGSVEGGVADPASEKQYKNAMANLDEEERQADLRYKRYVDQQEANAKASEAKAKYAADQAAKAAKDLHKPTTPSPWSPKGPQTIPTAAERGEEDPFLRSLFGMDQKLQIDQLKVKSDMNKDADSIIREAKIAFLEKYKAGDFDPGHDPNKRAKLTDKNDEFGIDWNKIVATDPISKKGYTAQDWVNKEVQLSKLQEQTKALTFANERLVASEDNANAALGRTTGNTAKQSREFMALKRELDRAGERLTQGTKEFNEWDIKKNQALFNQSRADAVNWVADFANNDRKSMVDLLPTQRERTAAKYDAQALKDKQQYQNALLNMAQSYSDTYGAISNDGTLTEQQKVDKLTALQQQYATAREKIETGFTSHMEVQNQLRERALRSSLDVMAEQWKDTYQQLQQQETQWADGFIGVIDKFVTTGKIRMSSFFEGIAMNIFNDRLKATIADPLSNVIGKFGTWVQGSVMPKSGAAATGTDAGTALTGVAAASGEAKNAISAMTTKGVEQATQGFVQQVATQSQQQVIATETTTSLASLSNSAMMASNSLMQVAANGAGHSISSLFAFANGGIMSGIGPVALRAYANGGVANTPQLAMFGEGSMPEAYVPLPDGRTIPVTMKGGQGAGNVTVNVINQSGQPVNAQQGAPRFDGRQMILDVVLTAAQTPGSFRDSMKGALS